MASVKICDLSGDVFIERAPNSIRINDGVIYDDNGRPRPFSGELCPECGKKVYNTHKSIQMIAPPRDFHDSEGDTNIND